MKVLIYVEPHPLRGSMVHFNNVAREFLSVLGSRDGYDVRMYANNETFLHIEKEIPDAVKQSLIKPLASESRMFQRYLKNWHEEGIEHWLDLMNGGQVADGYVEVLRRIWRIFPFDVIIHWGENGAVTRFVEGRPIVRIGMELGCTRSPFMSSIVMDPYGTNGAALVPRLDISEIQDIVGDKLLPAADSLFAYAENIGATAYEDQFRPPPSELPAAFLRGEKTVFLPLQLYDDANLLRFSPYGTVTDVVMDIVPKLVKGGCKVIIKPHPASKFRANAHLENMIAKNAIEPWASSVFWCDENNAEYNNPRLISISDAVVTVNSSTGFEALYYDKPVVVMGDAVYKPTGLFPTLEQLLSDGYDKDKYLHGISLLRRFFMDAYLRPASERMNHALFMQMVGLINGLWRIDRTPAAMAWGIYQSLSIKSAIFAKTAMLKGVSVAGVNEFGVAKNIASVEKNVLSGKKSDMDMIHLARQLIADSEATDYSGFSEWLDETLKDEGSRYILIEKFSLVDGDYYLDRYQDVKRAEICPLEHYAAHGFLEGRSPRRTIKEEVGALEDALLCAANEVFEGDSGFHPLPEDKERSRQLALQAISEKLSTSANRICVVAHLYYTDLVDDLLSKLACIDEGFDLIATLPDWGADAIENKVRKKFPDAIFYRAANRGRDIAPFLDVLPLLMDAGREIVLKVQTKRGYYSDGRFVPEFGDIWREECLDLLLGGKAQVARIVSHLRDEKLASMVGPAPYFVSLKKYPYHDNGGFAQFLMGDDAFAKTHGFFAGTMFWARLDCLQPLSKYACLSMTSFADETGKNDGELADLVERAFGHLAGKANGVSVIDEEGGLTSKAQPSEKSIHQHLSEREASIAAAKGSERVLIW